MDIFLATLFAAFKKNNGKWFQGNRAFLEVKCHECVSCRTAHFNIAQIEKVPEPPSQSRMLIEESPGFALSNDDSFGAASLPERQRFLLFCCSMLRIFERERESVSRKYMHMHCTCIHKRMFELALQCVFRIFGFVMCSFSKGFCL